MHLKTVDRSAKLAFCPTGPYMACGTLAGAVDTDFSSSSQLEIFGLELSDSSRVMPLYGQALTAKDRFHALTWGAGADAATFPRGIIAGGLADGSICLWNPERLISGKGEPLACHLKKHTGPVKGLDLNPFQANLFASASGPAELCIWDVSNAAMPSLYQTPQNERAGTGEVVQLSWNYKVQHILATTASGGQTVVWDLRREKPVISFSDPTRGRNSAFSWHPSVATQLIVASDEDRAAALQLWDLRNSSGPVREFAGHAKGVLSLSWSLHDPRLLLSSARDARTICWDMDAGVPVTTLSTEPNWSREVLWCPSARGVFATATLDGKVSLHNLLACTAPKVVQEIGPDFQPVSKVVGAPRPLAVAPRWLERPCAATFGFGGRLATVSTAVGQAPAPGVPHPASAAVSVRQVQAGGAAQGLAADLGRNVADRSPVALRRLAKASQAADPSGAWSVIRAQFEVEARVALLRQLGFALPGEEAPADGAALHGDGAGFFDEDRASPEPKVEDPDAVIGRLLMRGQFEEAVVECLRRGRVTDALLVASMGGAELLAATCDECADRSRRPYMQTVLAASGADMGNAVEQADPDSWRETLALLCTYAPPEAFSGLAVQLATKLEALGEARPAALVYTAAGDAENAVRLWAAEVPADASSDDLRALVERSVALSEASGAGVVPSALAARLSRLALDLASQGRMDLAVPLLELAPGEDTAALKDRIDRCWDPDMATGTRPFPYAVEDVQAVPEAPEGPVRQESFGAGGHGGQGQDAYGYQGQQGGYGGQQGGYGGQQQSGYGGQQQGGYGGQQQGGYGGQQGAFGGQQGGYGGQQGGYGGQQQSGYGGQQGGYQDGGYQQTQGSPAVNGGYGATQPASQAYGYGASQAQAPSSPYAAAAPAQLQSVPSMAGRNFSPSASVNAAQGPAVPSAQAPAAAPTSFSRHVYNTGGNYNAGRAGGQPAPGAQAVPASGGYAMQGRPQQQPQLQQQPSMGGWGGAGGIGATQVQPTEPSGAMGGWGANAPAMATPAMPAAVPQAPSMMVPGQGMAPPQPSQSPQGPPPNLALSSFDEKALHNPKFMDFLRPFKRLLEMCRHSATVQGMPAARHKELDDIDRKLGQQLVWQLMQGSMRPEIQQLLFVLGYAVERQETERVTHFVTSLVKGYFDECPWIPSLKRLFKLSGL